MNSDEKAAMPPSEQTPLLVHVRVGPPRQRYPHNVLRRFCTIGLGACLFLVILAFLLPTQWTKRLDPGHLHRHHKPPHKDWPQSQRITYEELQEILLNTPEESKAREWSQYYTAGPHLAGKNLSQALWTRDRWQEFGVQDSSVIAYDIYINYPLGHSLALLESSSNEADSKAETGNSIEKADYTVKYQCVMEEDELDEDPTTRLPNRIPTFHGYSASGNVTAQYVYVNFGTYKDFDDLVQANVSLEGKIAIAKYGGIFRGLKVKRAQELGMIGTVLYTDPEEDGEFIEQNGYETYPNGPARNPSSVQRGSTQFLSIAPGDPTTVGYPSKPGVPRQDPHGSIPAIPSVPISYADALPILTALNGHGPKASDFGFRWQGGKLGYKGVEYNIGPSPPNLVLNLVNEQEYVTTPLWNVIGIINGTSQSEVVVLGNHRDAWIAGGAGDPNSGSAALNELIRSFGVALARGWKPLRTIVFASWDGEEYGLIGSTEWVEEYIPWLSGAAVAYLNVDVGARGDAFSTAASPLLHKAIYEATALVQSPNQTIKGQTVRDTWNGQIRTIGSGSDFTAFQDFAGIPSVDLGFGHSSKAVYHYHSNYDSFAWMDNWGDKGWHYHVAITKVWALLAASLVETPIIRFNATDYAVALGSYLERITDKATESSFSSSSSSNRSAAIDAYTKTRAFGDLKDAIKDFQNATVAFDAHAAQLAEDIKRDIPWWKWWEKVKRVVEVTVTNVRYKALDRLFLYQKGLDGRSWFKHVVFAPGIWTGYAGATFPGLVETIDAGDENGVERWSYIIEGAVRNATALLREN